MFFVEMDNLPLPAAIPQENRIGIYISLWGLLQGLNA
jgi:hypothetical protein